MEKGDILGHEFMGKIEAIGDEVKNFKVGDRVVTSFCISCGNCFYCKQGLFSSCDGTNPSKKMESLFSHRTSGMFGYSHLTGGYDGGQAEYVRVPLADFNCLKLPENIPDEKLLFLSDVVCTAYHATEMGQVSKGQTVAVWGLGPVGLMTCEWAKFRGAKKIIGIDLVDYRLKMAKEKLGIQIIDISKVDCITALHEMCPQGPDVCIDAVGVGCYPKSLLSKFEKLLHLQTDQPEILREAITSCRKNGIISIVGDYFFDANQFPIGPFMEKGLTLRGGQTPVQKYWKELLEIIQDGKFDPSFVVTHSMTLASAEQAYKLFDGKEDNMIKVLLRTKALTSM